MAEIKVKYLVPDLGPIKQAHKKEWFDLRAAHDCKIRPGQLYYIHLGVAIELPEDHEAILAMRSSASRKYRIMPANGIGVIDNKYCGDNDEWIMPVVNFSDKIQHIKKGERICQFKIVKQQPLYDIRIVDMLNNPDRKGLGSTGRE